MRIEVTMIEMTVSNFDIDSLMEAQLVELNHQIVARL
jgi:hypothetical protein